MPLEPVTPGCRVKRFEDRLTVDLRPESEPAIMLFRVVVLTVVGSIGVALARQETTEVVGLPWFHLLPLVLGGGFMLWDLLKGIGSMVTLEITADVLRYRRAVVGRGELRKFALSKVHAIRFVQGDWNTDGPPSALAFGYSFPWTTVRPGEGLEDADLHRLLDAIRSFRPNLCGSVQSRAPDPPTRALTTINLS